MKTETKNLILRPIELSDFDRLFEIYSNPLVMKYIYDGSLFSKEKTMVRIHECIDHWKKYGFGFNVMIEKSTSGTAGYCVLRHFDNCHPKLEGKIEIGYILNQPFWNKGYATEAVKACIKIGFEQHHFNEILATILPENIASQNVVKKAGMTHVEDLIDHNLLHQIYSITNEQYYHLQK